ncbi:hypothetical protein ES703_112883 [subsurface metagenome]
MTLKIGVDVTELYERLYDILPAVERCVTAYGGKRSMIASTREGEWGRFAARRNVLMVDIRGKKNGLLVCRKLKEWLGLDYNIVEDNGIIRIKWDPKREKGNEKCQ